MSSSMLPLVSSRKPMCSGGAVVGIAGGEELDRLRLARFDDLEVVGGQAGDRRSLLVGDDDAEVDEIDSGAEGLLRGRRRVTVARRGRECEDRSRHEIIGAMFGSDDQNTL